MSYKKVITTEETFEFDYPPSAQPPMQPGTMLTMMPPRMPLPPPPPFPGWGNVGNTMPNTSPTLTSIFSNVLPENTPEGIALRLNSRDSWAKVAWYLRSAIVSIISGNPDSDYVLTKSASVSKDFMDIIQQYYGLRPDLKTAVDHYVASLVGLITAKKNNVGVDAAITELKTATSSLAAQLGAISFGPLVPLEITSDMRTLLESVVDNITKQTDARMAKDWVADSSKLDELYSLLVSGDPQGRASLADVITKIIVSTNSNRFPA